MQIIKVKFAQGENHMPVNATGNDLYHRQYDYFYVEDDKLKAQKNMYAVVEVQGRMKIVKVMDVGQWSGKATKYAITVFCLEDHQARVNHAEEIASLKDAISNRMQEARKMEELARLSEHDPVLHAMFEELKALQEGNKEA